MTVTRTMRESTMQAQASREVTMLRLLPDRLPVLSLRLTLWPDGHLAGNRSTLQQPRWCECQLSGCQDVWDTCRGSVCRAVAKAAQAEVCSRQDAHS